MIVADIYHSITDFIRGFFSLRNYTLRNFTAYLLVIMIIQYIPLESRAGVSPVKVVTMAIAPIFFLANFSINRAVILGGIYYAWIFFTAYFLHPLTFRASTVIYCGMFVMTYITFYTLVNDVQVFKLNWFIRFLKGFIWVFAGFCVVQQFMLLLGIWYFPPFNMVQWMLGGGVMFRVNSLSYEPSTFARSMLVLYYAYMKCSEYRQGSKINLFQAFSGEYRWVSIAFVWCMTTMGSGTAFACLAIMSLYFLRGRYMILTAPIFVAVFFLLKASDNAQFNRMTAVAEAATTLDPETARETDTSAAVRLGPILNTWGNLDKNIGDPDFWIGHGCDYSLGFRYHSEKRQMGEIDDYGLISYILSLCLVFGCAIRFRSLATVMFFFGVGGGTNNIAYCWGLLYAFTVVRYFYNHRYDQDDDDEEDEDDEEDDEEDEDAYE